MSKTKTPLETALEYAAAGIPVCAYARREFDAKSNKFKKDPCIKEQPHGVNDSTTDPKKIRCIFANPEATHVGTKAGKLSKLYFIDGDTYAPESGKAVADYLSKNADKFPETMKSRTMSGGLRYVYKYDGELDIPPSTGLDNTPGLEFLAASGVVLPDYKDCKLLNCKTVTEGVAMIAPLPEWLIQMQRATLTGSGKKKTLVGGLVQNWYDDSLHELLPGERHNTLYSLAGFLHSRGIPTKVIYLALCGENLKCNPAKSDAELQEIAEDITKYPVNVSEDIPDKYILQCLHNNEVGDATLFIRLSGGKYKYCVETKEWLAWDGCVWEKQVKSEVDNLLANALSEPYLALSFKTDEECVAATLADDKTLAKSLSKTRDELRSRAFALKGLSRVDKVLKFVSRETSQSLLDFDIDPLEINLQNGVFDLDKMEFRPHRTDDLFIKCAGTEYVEGAESPFFLDFLDMVLCGNAELITYVQKLFGVYLTGLTDTQMFAYCWGDGKNGKSTYFNILKMLLGDYYHAFPVEVLLSGQAAASTEYQKAEFYGKRLIVATEIPEGRRMQESEVKNLTGGDTVTARPIYGKPFSFNPTHKLAFFGNHKLVITGSDAGIWRRVKMIPFTCSIPDDKCLEMSEVMRRIKEELPGVLLWSIEGYRLYKEEGLIDPVSVSESTQEYKDDNDTLKIYLEEGLMKDPDGKIKLTEVLAGYINWCKHRQKRAKYDTSKVLAAELRKRDIETIEGAGHARYVIGYREVKFSNSGFEE